MKEVGASSDVSHRLATKTSPTNKSNNEERRNCAPIVSHFSTCSWGTGAILSRDRMAQLRVRITDQKDPRCYRSLKNKKFYTRGPPIRKAADGNTNCALLPLSLKSAHTRVLLMRLGRPARVNSNGGFCEQRRCRAELESVASRFAAPRVTFAPQWKISALPCADGINSRRRNRFRVARPRCMYCLMTHIRSQRDVNGKLLPTAAAAERPPPHAPVTSSSFHGWPRIALSSALPAQACFLARRAYAAAEPT